MENNQTSVRSSDNRYLPATHNERVYATKNFKDSDLQNLIIENSQVGRLLQDRKKIKVQKKHSLREHNPQLHQSN